VGVGHGHIGERLHCLCDNITSHVTPIKLRALKISKPCAFGTANTLYLRNGPTRRRRLLAPHKRRNKVPDSSGHAAQYFSRKFVVFLAIVHVIKVALATAGMNAAGER
jgi:hypothetical protein